MVQTLALGLKMFYTPNYEGVEESVLLLGHIAYELGLVEVVRLSFPSILT
jgi:hypothetical protein